MTASHRPRRPGTLTLPVAIAFALAAVAVTPAAARADAEPAAAATADRPPVTAVLLPATRARVVAVDLSATGVVAATAGPATTGIPAPTTDGSVPQRWLPLPRGRFLSQELPLPAGATGAAAAGVSAFGEVAATVGLAGDRDPFRWSMTGRSSTRLGDGTPHTAAAVDARGDVLVNSGDAFGFTGDSALHVVRRDGTAVEITGFSGGIRGFFGADLAGPDLALVQKVEGIGQGTSVVAHVWQAGAEVGLPVFGGGPGNLRMCLSRLQPDGSVAYSGFRIEDVGLQPSLGIHRGGPPGTEAPLPQPPGRRAVLGCPDDKASGDVLATDGTAGGQLLAVAPGEAGERGAPAEAVVWRGDGYVLPGLRAGEASSSAVSVARGGRAVVRVTRTDGSVGLYLWRDGVRTPLAVPGGWQVADVVAMNDHGDVLANLVGADGVTRRPAVWRTGP
jgi:hypothetical protein